MMNRLQLPIATRHASVTPSSINSQNRTVDVVWTTGAPVKRADWLQARIVMEELVVAGANLERLNAGAPVLNGHSSRALSDVIGVVERAWLDAERRNGYATIRFSDRADVAPIWNDVETGILKNISVGYSVDEAQRIPADKNGQPDTLRVTRFTPMELSLVAVPADHMAQIRSKSTELFPCSLYEAATMTDDNTEVVETSPPEPLETVRSDYRRLKKIGAREAVLKDRKRVAELNELFELDIVPHDEMFRAVRMRAIEEGWAVEATRKWILEALSDGIEPAVDHTSITDDGQDMSHAPIYRSPPSGQIYAPNAPNAKQSVRAAPSAPGVGRQQLGQRVELVRDNAETLAQSIEQALLIRCGVEKDQSVIQDARERGVVGLTYIEMGRSLMDATGQCYRSAGLDKHGVARQMLKRAGPMTHTDFPNILASVATKIAKKGYTEAPTTWKEWCNTATLPDFKPATIPGLGAFSDLDRIPKGGGPYMYGTVGENYETAELETYGRLFGISRVALVNDDLNLFARAGLAMGASAARKINSLAYLVLTANQTMSEDGKALFHADHSNYVAQGSGAAPSIATLNTAEASMALQQGPRQSTDASVAYLNTTPAHLLVPMSLKATAETLFEAPFDPAGTTASKSVRDAPNIWRGRLKVTADAMLGSITATGWYLAAAQNNSAIDTVTMFFLEGQGEEPYTEEQQQFDTDGITYKVRIDAVARALDFRGMYFNYGA